MISRVVGPSKARGVRKDWVVPELAQISVREAFGSNDGPVGPFGSSATADGPLPPMPSPSVTGPLPPTPSPGLFGPLPPTPAPSFIGPLPPEPGPALFGPFPPLAESQAMNGPFPPASDIALKESISRIGTTAHDLPLYTFRYKGCDGLYQGVMAQDVLKVMPEAVTTDPQGFYRVDYAMLGVEFKRLS